MAAALQDRADRDRDAVVARVVDAVRAQVGILREATRQLVDDREDGS